MCASLYIPLTIHDDLYRISISLGFWIAAAVTIPIPCRNEPTLSKDVCHQFKTMGVVAYVELYVIRYSKFETLY
jgi:hypothetical protein